MSDLGCYDLLHSGHVEFFLEASQYGDLYVALGSDKTIVELKGRPPVNPQDERLFMVKQLRCVTDVSQLFKIFSVYYKIFIFCSCQMLGLHL